jgi:hypothetical protein
MTKTSIDIRYGRNEPPYRESNRNSTRPNGMMKDISLTVKPPKDEKVDQESTKRRRIEKHGNTEKGKTDTEPGETSADEVEANNVQVISCMYLDETVSNPVFSYTSGPSAIQKLHLSR